MKRTASVGEGSRSSGRMSLRTAILIGPGGLLAVVFLAHAVGLTNGRMLTPSEAAERAMTGTLCTSPPAVTNRYITSRGWDQFVAAGWCPTPTRGHAPSVHLVVINAVNHAQQQAFVEGQLFIGERSIHVNIELDRIGGGRGGGDWAVTGFAALP